MNGSEATKPSRMKFIAIALLGFRVGGGTTVIPEFGSALVAAITAASIAGVLAVLRLGVPGEKG